MLPSVNVCPSATRSGLLLSSKTRTRPTPFLSSQYNTAYQDFSDWSGLMFVPCSNVGLYEVRLELLASSPVWKSAVLQQQPHQAWVITEQGAVWSLTAVAGQYTVDWGKGSEHKWFECVHAVESRPQVQNTRRGGGCFNNSAMKRCVCELSMNGLNFPNYLETFSHRFSRPLFLLCNYIFDKLIKETQFSIVIIETFTTVI